MIHAGLIFAILGVIAFALWTVFHQQASGHINNIFGAVVVSFTATLVGLIFLLPQAKHITLYSNPKGLIFAVLAGLTAFGIDYFILKAYGSGLQVSIVGPLIIGGSIALASAIGFFLGDSVTLPKIIGLVLVIIGAAILAATST